MIYINKLIITINFLKKIQNPKTLLLFSQSNSYFFKISSLKNLYKHLVKR